jgi:3',5'-cyclic AMP phosphodiesterase CpdA
MTSPFTFLVANDLHYHNEQDDPWLARLFDRMNGQAEQPEFLLLLGDLAENGSEQQLTNVKSALDWLAMPVYPVIGNHDYVEATDRTGWNATFGQTNYRFEHRGWQFLGLDSTVGTPYEDILMPESTLEWVSAELAGLSREQPLVFFTHFPIGAGIRWRPRNAEELLERFVGWNLRAGFSGHFHGAVEQEWNGALLRNGACCALRKHNHDESPAKGYLLCEASAGGELRCRFVQVSTEGLVEKSVCQV